MRNLAYVDTPREILPLKPSKRRRSGLWKSAPSPVMTADPLGIEDAHLLKISAVLPQAITAHLAFLDATTADSSEVPNSHVYLPAPHAHRNLRPANSTRVEIAVDSP